MEKLPAHSVEDSSNELITPCYKIVTAAASSKNLTDQIRGAKVLRSFEIQRFRAFSHLTVPELGRVNLVVGKNNVGKTMFLEALRLYAMGGSPRALRNLLIERDEIHTESLRGEEEQELQLRFPSLFHRSDAQMQPTLELRLGEMRNESRRLTITARLFRRVKERQPVLATHRYEVADVNDDKSEPHLLPGLAVAIGDHERIYPFSVINGYRQRTFLREELGEPAFVPARGVGEREMARWWDVIALRDSESRVLDCLRLISPIERVTLVEHPYRRGERIALVRLTNELQPIPLKSMGDGLSRMFQIALAMENSRSTLQDQREGFPELFPKEFEGPLQSTGLLLIDELENGIHYSVHAKLWTFLIQMARQHNVQVFATTHSWDCICGLREAVASMSANEAVLIRLERKGDRNKAVLFPQHELSIITRDDIEVR